VALLVARLSGPHAFLQLALAGTAGMLAYVPLAVSREQLRQWAAALPRFGRRPVSSVTD
jgi:PST family polysaccharide transporter